ncbi:PAS domain S-box protein [Methanosarcina sp. MSH10X1]|uniref:PAS domain S-box protein n=1 Tax=Methanosarcina sp. MSH10X1 TaxID=2507075 RepID=UPI000FFB245B|nr:PAS domain S-box protein [Methanosarcina sp. MSH10X1]RXA20575.1 PAS domain S-box protein [Methanosarcina sp. MSH10X1]
MRSGSRISGIDIIGNVPRRTHFCQFYQSKEDLVDILIPYFKVGLENKEFCLWVLSGQLDEKGAKEILEAGVPDVNAYFESGQIEIIPYTCWHVEEDALDSWIILNHLIEKTSKALASGYNGLRYSGDDLSFHEKILDSVIDKCPVTALCTYPIDKCTAVEILDIVSSHQLALMKKENTWEIIESSCQKSIMECKQAEVELSRSEERFRALVTASSEVVYRVSPDWSEMHYLYGRGFLADTESPSHAWLQEYIPPEDQLHVIAVINEAIRMKSIYELEHKVRLADGSLGWVFSRAVPMLDANGEIIEWFGTASDITERKKVEAKLKDTLDNLDKLVKERTEELQMAYDSLKKNEKILAEAQEIAHLGSWELDFESNEFRWSNELYRIFGLKPQESKVNYDTFLNYIHPEDRKHIDNALKRALKGKPSDINFRITLANGEERIVYAKSEVVFDEKNNPVRVRGTTQDITEHRKAEEKLIENEEKYRNIVETANELILTTDNKAVITYVNKRMVDMLGYTIEDSIGRPIWDFISEECKPVVKKNLEKRRQGISESYELKLIRKDGSPLWGFLNVKPLFNKEGKYTGAMSMLTDITKRKEAEETLTNTETARKKEIHHRIKNNLQVISSLLDLQAEQFKNRADIRDSEVLEAFRESQDRVTSMALIHEELYRGGGFETLNFSPYIRELADTLFRTYRLGNTDISLNMDMEENLLLDMDTAIPLGIIINELVSNSLKHAFPDRRKGEIRIRLHREESTEPESEDSDSISSNFIFTISDNGVGIPENLDVQDLDSLGMQLVISLVDQLDGELELRRDNGTEFAIRFRVTEKSE